ncbi:ABC transporter substrate-binding protein [Nakamurella sp. GG22]
MTKSPRTAIRSAIAATAIAAALVLSACSSGGDSASSSTPSAGASGSAAASGDPGEAVTITLGTQTAQGGEGPYRPVIAAFEKENPNITVNLVETPTDSYAQVLRTQLQAGNAPDVFYGQPGAGNPNAILPSGEAGYAADLSSYSWATDAIPANSETLFTVDGKTYGIPVDLAPVSMIANLTAYKELGIEPATTRDEAYEQCATAKAAGKSLYMIAGAGPPNLGLFASQIAASLVYGADPDWNTKRANGEVTFVDSPEWKATLQQVIDYKDKGCFPDGVEGAGFPELTNAITSGTSLGIFAPSGAVVDSKAAAPTQEFGAYVLPAATVADTRAILSTTNGLAVNAASPNQDAALKLLEFFSKPTTQDLFAKSSGNVSLAATPSTGVPADLAGLGDYLTDPAKNVPLANLFWPNGGIYDALGTGVQGLLTGQATPEVVLEAMDAAWDQTS